MCGLLIEGSTVIPAGLSGWPSPLFGADVPGHGISSALGDMNLETEESEPCGAACGFRVYQRGVWVVRGKSSTFRRLLMVTGGHLGTGIAVGQAKVTCKEVTLSMTFSPGSFAAARAK